jgi:hypothetical protein
MGCALVGFAVVSLWLCDTTSAAANLDNGGGTGGDDVVASSGYWGRACWDGQRNADVVRIVI